MSVRPNLSPIISGLSSSEVELLRKELSNTEFWDTFRARVDAVKDQQDESDLVMSFYHLMNQQSLRIKWVQGITTYSWIDVALYLESYNPSYVDNFCENFRIKFQRHLHYAFYKNEEEVIHFNRVFPGIKVFSKTTMKEVVKNLSDFKHT